MFIPLIIWFILSIIVLQIDSIVYICMCGRTVAHFRSEMRELHNLYERHIL